MDSDQEAMNRTQQISDLIDQASVANDHDQQQAVDVVIDILVKVNTLMGEIDAWSKGACYNNRKRERVEEVGPTVDRPLNPLFRALPPLEQKFSRKWARDNYTKGEPIKGIWHPVVQDECVKINAGFPPEEE